MSKVKSIWLLSDGKAGHEAPLIGVADAIGSHYEIRRVKPRRIIAALALWGPIDPRDKKEGGVLAAPYPDICLASGRRTVPYLRALKTRSPDTFCVYFKDPRTKRSGADMLVTMVHDCLSGPTIFTTRTTPHKLTTSVLDAARAVPLAEIDALPRPRVAVLIGGDSRHHSFSNANIGELLSHLKTLQSGGASLMITISRRTPIALQNKIFSLRALENVLVWDGREPNPLAQYLAHAEAVVVTSDSINMVGEAAASGKPIHLFHPTGFHPKFAIFLEELAKIATIRQLDGVLGGDAYVPVDSTGEVAAEIVRRQAEFSLKKH